MACTSVDIVKRKILDAVTSLTSDSVLPVVIVSGGNPEATAKKVTVQQILNSIIAGVSSVNGKTGAVTLTGLDIKLSPSDNTTLNEIVNEVVTDKQDAFTIVTDADPTSLIPLPNTVYDFGDTAISELTITSYTKSYDESVIYFTSGVGGTTITLPDNISWVNGIPTIESNTKYVISICNGAIISGSY